MSRKINPEAIRVLKEKMTLGERQQFVRNCTIQQGSIINDEMMGNSIYFLLCHQKNSFKWESSNEGLFHWAFLMKRFTTEELLTRVFLD